MLATNAIKIVDLRSRGYRPDEMILVSLVGKIDELNHTVFAMPNLVYDWGWCKGLDVCVFASSGVDWLETVDAISKQNPRFLALWDTDRQEGSEIFRSLNLIRSGGNWRVSGDKLDYLPWCSIENKLFNGELCS